MSKPTDIRSNIETVNAVDPDGRYIFVSYSHKDSEVVRRDVAELRRHGAAIWFDESLLPGPDWDTVVLRILKDPNCVCAMLYLSENSIVSPAVERELARIAKKFGRHDAADKTSKSARKGYFSVNIGGASPSAMRTAAVKACASRAERRRVGAISRRFCRRLSDKGTYIPRSADPDDLSHIESLLDCLTYFDVVKPGVCDEFRYDCVEGGVRILKYSGSQPEVAVRSEISGMPVVAIGSNAFSAEKGEADGAVFMGIEKLVLPDTVVSIGDEAFTGQSRLREIDLPPRLETLGVAAFRGTSALREVRLPKGLNVISEALFRDSGVERVTLPEGITRIGEAAFRGSAITSIEVPHGVTEMGEAVFLNCAQLESAHLPDTLERMTEGGFKGCARLRELTVPQTVAGLNAGSFSDCLLLDVTVGEWHYHDGLARRI